MKVIFLVGRKYGGMFALVDDDDFDRLNAYRWYAHFPKRSRTVYARTVIDGKTVYMHQMAVGKVGDGLEIDHFDRNGLNNQRYNFRIVTHAVNTENGKRLEPASNVHTVKRRLADGSIRIHYYDRKTGAKIDAPNSGG